MDFDEYGLAPGSAGHHGPERCGLLSTPGPYRLPARHGGLRSAVLPPANQPFMDDYIAYALVLIALPWPAQPTWRFGRAYPRTVTGTPLPALHCADRHARAGR